MRVEVVRYVPVPKNLTQQCTGYQGPLETNDDLANAYITEKKEGTDCANEKLRQIRMLE